MQNTSTAQQQADEVQRIGELIRPHGNVIRCDGTAEAFESYRDGSNHGEWRVAMDATSGDLLVSSIGSGRARQIVSLCLIEEVTDEDVLWDPNTDVSIKPSLSWHNVMRRANLPTRAWPALDSSAVPAFVNAVRNELHAAYDVSDEEGARHLSSCRTRSRANRIAALERARGQCTGCGVNLREVFGARGDRGLEVHHQVPLSQRDSVTVTTKVSDLDVLCATCHRLIHADPQVDLARLRAGWIYTK